MPKRRVKAATRHARAKRDGIAALGGYEAQLAAQGGGCAICGKPPTGRRLHIDHDHKTGKVRGLLCWQDNAIIGRARDDWRRLSGAGVYLCEGWQGAVAFHKFWK